MLFILLLITAFTLFYAYVKWCYTYWKRRDVPHPKPTFLVGNLGSTLNMTSHMSLLCEQWYKDYPNCAYTGYFKMLAPAINVRDPDLVKDILMKDHFSWHRNEQYFSKRFDPLMAYNPFVATNDYWKRSRSMLTPLTTSFRVKTLFPHIADTCKRLTDYLKTIPPNKDIETKVLSSRFATQNVIMCSFSIDSKCFSDGKSEFRELGKKIFQPTDSGGFILMLMTVCPFLVDIIPMPFIPRDIDKWYRKFVSQLKEERLQRPPAQDDLFQMLLNNAKGNGTAVINDEEITGHALSLFTEGFETSSTVLAFALYEMAKNPDIQEALYEEIIDVLSRHDNQLTYEALQEMEYLDNCIHESMRLHPVLPFISKVCTKKFTLPKLDGQSEPVTVEPGTVAQISIMSLHMDPKYYPDPEVFDPNRFDKEERRNRHKGVYLAFSEGPRMCTGIRFGLAQTKAGLMTVVKNYKISLSSKQKPYVMDIRAFLLQARDGLWINLMPRNYDNNNN